LLQEVEETSARTFSLVKIAARDAPGFLKRNGLRVVAEGERASDVLGKFGLLIDKTGIHASARSLV
jgi:hypothetical protein